MIAQHVSSRILVLLTQTVLFHWVLVILQVVHEAAVLFLCNPSRQSSALIASLRQNRRVQETPVSPCDLVEDTQPSCSEARPMTLRVRISKKTHRITVQTVRPSLITCLCLLDQVTHSAHCSLQCLKVLRIEQLQLGCPSVQAICYCND